MTELHPVKKPVVYIIHGDDLHSIRRHLKELIEGMGDPGLVDLNTTRLDGRQANDDDLYAAANSLPFLADRRLVILTQPFARIQSDAARKRFLVLLSGLPETTALVLVVEDEFERKKGGADWRSLSTKNTFWVRKWMNEVGSRVSYKLCQLPPIREMPTWIAKEATRLGGKISMEAAAALANHVGNDTQMAGLELDKLLTYVDFKRTVEFEDVEELTAQNGQADVFDMVDSLAAGNGRQAINLLHRLLESQDPQSLFGMVVRQFRLLIQARELMDEGHGNEIARALNTPQFVADKITGQARRFSLPRLEELYHRLLLMDEAMKTSQMPLDLALDTFVAGVSR